MSLFCPIPKGRGGSRARRTFQALFNISFPKIVGEQGRGRKNCRTCNFSLHYRNSYNFSVTFSFIIYQNASYNYYFSNFFAELYFLPDERVFKIARQNN